ncbi:23785_t:CDS:2 [Dentiscutata erythropus]|uniref:23785_t:CDS:1 n=1 Tax=Dentiscutata erythropus TaxID=1348616 RepID=A0A9N9D1T7_9GLOM|nr:23785_t:CDS:2 [Dentiscutata erythropus]
MANEHVFVNSTKQRRGRYATNACTNCHKNRGPKAANKSANVFENNFNEATNFEQKHTMPLTEFQFGASVPFYFNYNYNEGFQQIQNDFFPYIDTNYIILNDNTPANLSNTFSLPSNLPPSSFSLTSHLDYLFE